MEVLSQMQQVAATVGEGYACTLELAPPEDLDVEGGPQIFILSGEISGCNLSGEVCLDPRNSPQQWQTQIECVLGLLIDAEQEKVLLAAIGG